MGQKDYYAILGVGEDAKIDQIQKAYRAMAMKFHPDRNPADKKKSEEKFKEISEAYYVLSDEKRRGEYDAFRKGGYSSYGNGQTFHGAQGFDFEEILRRFAGSGGGYSRGRSGASSSRGNFEDIFSMFSHMGKGGAAQYGYSGEDMDDGYSPRESTDFNASLSIPEKVAREGGEVLFRHKGRKITLKIKPGTVSGQKLRMRDQGEVCRCCGHTGDLIVTLKVSSR
jgi:DnaJ-class molecular chaperone